MSRNFQERVAVEETRKLGYLVPQFPGQTHIFFWREILNLEAMDVDPVLFSTTPPPEGLVSHLWSKGAMSRTEYLASRSIFALLMTLPRLPWRKILKDREGKGFLRDVIISAPAARRLAQSCRAQGVTHVHAHSCGRAAMIAALAHELYGLDYSVSLHGPLQDYGPGQKFKWRGAKFATVITQKLIAEIKPLLGDALPKRVVQQAMGVDTNRLRRETPYEPAKPGQPLRLFTCARLHFVKGHTDVFQAVRQLLDRGIDVYLDIAGEDDDGGSGYRAELEQQVAEMGLLGRVRLLGAVSEDTVRDRILASHVFVLASWAEPLGVAYMEAMSCECPVIGTDAGGVPELITNGKDGILVPPQNPDALAAALEYLALDPERAKSLATEGRKTVMGRFDSARGAETLVTEAGV